jgi:hypothetical protein
MAWKLAKDYSNPMWGPRPIRAIRPIHPIRPIRPIQPIRPIKPIAPIGYRFVWRKGKNEI